MWGKLSVKLLIFVCAVTLLATGAFAAPQLTSLNIQPNQISAGDTVQISYSLQDTSALGEVQTTIVLDNVINHGDVSATRQRTFSFTERFDIPHTYTGDGPLVLVVKVQDNYPIIRYINTQSASATARNPSIAYPTENSVYDAQENVFETRPYSGPGVDIIVDPVRDILRGAAVYYPVTLRNGNDRAVTMVLGVDPQVRGWATYRVDPEPVITVPANSERDVFIYFKSDEDAPLGQQRFTVTANTGARTYDAQLQLAVLDQEEPNTRTGMPKWAIALIIILIIAAAVIVAYIVWRNDKPPMEGNDDELLTYY